MLLFQIRLHETALEAEAIMSAYRAKAEQQSNGFQSAQIEQSYRSSRYRDCDGAASPRSLPITIVSAPHLPHTRCSAVQAMIFTTRGFLQPNALAEQHRCHALTENVKPRMCRVVALVSFPDRMSGPIGTPELPGSRRRALPRVTAVRDYSAFHCSVSIWRSAADAGALPARES